MTQETSSAVLGVESSNAAPRRSPVAVNGRFRVHKLTGMQRYANELISRGLKP